MAIFCCNKCITKPKILNAYYTAFSREVRIFNGLNLQIAIFFLTYKLSHKFNKDAILVENGGEQTLAEILIYNHNFTIAINDLKSKNFLDNHFPRKTVYDIACKIWEKSQKLLFSDQTLIKFLDETAKLFFLNKVFDTNSRRTTAAINAFNSPGSTIMNLLGNYDDSRISFGLFSENSELPSSGGSMTSTFEISPGTLNASDEKSILSDLFADFSID